jgi:hypothetical protein
MTTAATRAIGSAYLPTQEEARRLLLDLRRVVGSVPKLAVALGLHPPVQLKALILASLR